MFSKLNEILITQTIPATKHWPKYIHFENHVIHKSIYIIPKVISKYPLRHSVVSSHIKQYNFISAEDICALEFINLTISYFTLLHKQYTLYFCEIPQLSDVQVIGECESAC